ncbi:MAG TPA: hypothetical protein VHN78_02550 [Chloroflexota bacterium]|nr:hypothetical protein [Chloroflexota bacterium]
MDGTSRFGPSASDDAGQSAARADDEYSGVEGVEDEAAAGDEAPAPADERRPGGRAPDTPRRRAAKGKPSEDPAVWARRLEQLGFSQAEAGRLIFERMRPREEGLVRT